MQLVATNVVAVSSSTTSVPVSRQLTPSSPRLLVAVGTVNLETTPSTEHQESISSQMTFSGMGRGVEKLANVVSLTDRCVSVEPSLNQSVARLRLGYATIKPHSTPMLLSLTWSCT